MNEFEIPEFEVYCYLTRCDMTYYGCYTRQAKTPIKCSMCYFYKSPLVIAKGKKQEQKHNERKVERMKEMAEIKTEVEIEAKKIEEFPICIDCKNPEKKIQSRNRCAACYAKWYKENKGKVPMRTVSRKKEDAVPKEVIKKSSQSPRPVSIHFELHPLLYESLIRRAHDEFRTIENQILYFIKRGLSSS